MLPKIKFNKSLNFSNFKEVNNYIIMVLKNKKSIIIFHPSFTLFNDQFSKSIFFLWRIAKAQAKSTSKIGKDLVKYKLSNSNEVIVAKEGTVVNFLLHKSIEILFQKIG